MIKSIQICGTSGSGKTSVVRQYIADSVAVPILFNHKKKPTVYEGRWGDIPVFFLGSYETTCGGCDTIPSVTIVAELMEYLDNAYSDGVLLFEGLMISHMVGTVGNMQVKLGVERNVRAFLDTPLDVCLARVQARRDAAGNTKPFNPANTIKDHPRVIACRANCEKVGIKTYSIEHNNAYASVNNIFQELYYGE